MPFVAKIFAAEIREVASKVEVVMPVASNDPVLIFTPTKLGIVALLENKLAAEIKLDTKSVDVVIEFTLIEDVEIPLLANKLPPI